MPAAWRVRGHVLQWKKKYADLDLGVSELRKLKQIEDENARAATHSRNMPWVPCSRELPWSDGLASTGHTMFAALFPGLAQVSKHEVSRRPCRWPYRSRESRPVGAHLRAHDPTWAFARH